MTRRSLELAVLSLLQSALPTCEMSTRSLRVKIHNAANNVGREEQRVREKPIYEGLLIFFTELQVNHQAAESNHTSCNLL